jgi:general secretion pathway protein D
VVIGGLMRDTVRTGQTKVPILGDIPLLGVLFRKSEKKKEKKNLLLFLTPYIVRSPADLRSVYERKMRERQEFLDRYFVFSGTEYAPPVDYSRTRGLIGEILQEISAMDKQRKLLADEAAKPVETHKPQTAVGETMQDAEAGGAGDSGDKGAGPAPDNPPPPEGAPLPPPEAPPAEEPSP